MSALTDIEVRHRAEQLRRATRAGDLGRSYRVVVGLRCTDARAVLLRAGHSVALSNDRLFWTTVQSQLQRACSALLDGFELHQAARADAVMRGQSISENTR